MVVLNLTAESEFRINFLCTSMHFFVVFQPLFPKDATVSKINQYVLILQIIPFFFPVALTWLFPQLPLYLERRYPVPIIN